MNQANIGLSIGSAEPTTLAIIVGLLVLMFLAVPSIWGLRPGGTRLRDSMIERHRAKLKNEAMRRGRSSIKGNPEHLLHRLGQIFALIPSQMRMENQKLLRSAGFVDSRAIVIFWTIKTGCIVVGIVLFVIHLAIHVNGETNVYLIMSAAVGLGFFAPDIVVRRQKKVRLRRIERGLPDGLDLLVICAEAGLSLDSALKRVADEFVSMVPELSEELLLTSVELNFLPDRRQALSNLAQRVDVPALRGVTATLIQTEKYGTPLAQALRTLASEFRESRLLKAEEKAARLPAILTVPMIIFILPALFIVLAAPAFLKVAEKIGN
jgi:tight adherence protein C